MRIPQPFWNHNGGTLAFGPDGMLYITLGDGGKANDPLKAGQDKSTVLGKVLRIDVDHKDEGKNYAIPKDNPFVGEKNARGEIWAYGFRNPWRHSFDRETGALWLADVGQDKWEEIDIVVKGGNYGWNTREGLHNFAGKTDKTPEGMIDPIWEYNHIIGKSITGGVVYRGKQVPQLVGKYLYGDYVGKQIWALDYDAEAKKVVANYRIDGGEHPPLDIVSFGEDQSGEVYLLVSLGQIFKFKSNE
jgi:quinoprotein glucose dehydrogenase